MVWRIVFWVILGLAGLHAVLSIAPHFFTRRDRGGAPQSGLVIFVEPIRWLGVRWGANTLAAGLRRAGFEGEFHYWRWGTTLGASLVLPLLKGSQKLEAEARRLADFITHHHRERRTVPIHLIGYSCGGFIAIRALELLGDETCVDSAAILAGAISPRYNLSEAAGRVGGPLVVCSSLGDWIILGLGTLVFGTADRKHAPSVGMVGLRAGGQSTIPPNVVEIKWRLAMVRLGHLGGHFSAAANRFITRCVAPKMNLTNRS